MAITQTLDTKTTKSSRPSHRNGYQRSLAQLMNAVHEYLPEDEIEFIRSAYEYAYLAHDGQKRKSGEPFIIHPIIVSLRLAQLKLALRFDRRRLAARHGGGLRDRSR